MVVAAGRWLLAQFDSTLPQLKKIAKPYPPPILTHNFLMTPYTRIGKLIFLLPISKQNCKCDEGS
jgi:hypothetical protein